MASIDISTSDYSCSICLDSGAKLEEKDRLYFIDSETNQKKYLAQPIYVEDRTILNIIYLFIENKFYIEKCFSNFHPKCNHLYCTSCLDTLLNTKKINETFKSCPCCKQEFNEINPYVNSNKKGLHIKRKINTNQILQEDLNQYKSQKDKVQNIIDQLTKIANDNDNFLPTDIIKRLHNLLSLNEIHYNKENSFITKNLIFTKDEIKKIFDELISINKNIFKNCFYSKKIFKAYLNEEISHTHYHEFFNEKIAKHLDIFNMMPQCQLFIEKNIHNNTDYVFDLLCSWFLEKENKKDFEWLEKNFESLIYLDPDSFYLLYLYFIHFNDQKLSTLYPQTSINLTNLEKLTAKAKRWKKIKSFAKILRIIWRALILIFYFLLTVFSTIFFITQMIKMISEIIDLLLVLKAILF